MDFRAIEGVPPVMAWPVLDELDKALRLTHQLQDGLGQLKVSQFFTATDIVCLPILSLMQHQINRFTMVKDVQPVSHIEAVAVKRQRLIVEGVGDEERDHLFRVLVRPEVV